MANSLGSLTYQVSANVNGALSAFDRLSAGLKSLEGVAKGIDLGGAIKTGLAGLGATAGLTGIIKTGGELERVMARMKARVAPTTDEFAALNAEAIRLGQVTEYTAVAAAEGMSELSRHGFKTKEILGAIDPALKLASVGMIDIATAADIAATSMKTFRLKTGDFPRVADVFAYATSNAQVTMHEMGESMKYAGAIARTAGLSIEETTAAIMLLGDAGLRGGEAGTVLRNMLKKTADASGEARKLMDLFGISFQDASGNFIGFGKGLDLLNKKLAGLGDMAKLEAIGTLFEVRAGTGFAALLDKGGDYEKLLGRIKTESIGVAGAMQQVQLDTSWGRWKILVSTIEGTFIRLFDVIKPGLNLLMESINQFFTTINKAADGARDFFSAIADIGLPIIKSWAEELERLGIAATNLGSILGGLAGAMLGGKLFGPLGAIGGGVLGNSMGAFAGNKTGNNLGMMAGGGLGMFLGGPLGALVGGTLGNLGGGLLQKLINPDDITDAGNLADKLGDVHKQLEKIVEAGNQKPKSKDAGLIDTFREQADQAKKNITELENVLQGKMNLKDIGPLIGGTLGGESEGGLNPGNTEFFIDERLKELKEIYLPKFQKLMQEAQGREDANAKKAMDIKKAIELSDAIKSANENLTKQTAGFREAAGAAKDMYILALNGGDILKRSWLEAVSGTREYAGQLEELKRKGATADQLAPIEKKMADARVFQMTQKLTEAGAKLHAETRTPEEQFKSQMSDLGQLLKVGVIDEDLFKRGARKAFEGFDGNQPQLSSATLGGSAEAMSAVNRAFSGADSEAAKNRIIEQQLQEAQQANNALKELINQGKNLLDGIKAIANPKDKLAP